MKLASEVSLSSASCSTGELVGAELLQSCPATHEHYYTSVGGATGDTVVVLCMYVCICVSVCLSVGRISRCSLKSKR